MGEDRKSGGGLDAERAASNRRETKETTIEIRCDLETGAEPSVNTGLPFFDHLLTAMAFHGRFGLTVDASGDLDVDPHHLVEDTGLVLGDVLGDIAEREPIERFAHAVVPMDDACAEVTVDFGGRPYLVYRVDFPQPRAGSFDLSLLREFFNALSIRSRANIHLEGRYAVNGHHLAEALFKGLGLAIRDAFRRREAGGMSTKGLV